MKTLSIVIVSYNVCRYLEQCLLSVERATTTLDADVWVVDNASSDGTGELMHSRFPQVHFIENKENVGFSCANNMAIRASKSRYVLLLNPDTIVSETVLQQCVSFLDAHPEAGATGVSMLKDNGSFAWESRRGLPSPFTAFCKMSGLCTVFPRSRTFGRYYMRYLDREQVSEIEVISGAFNMLRREALDKVGLLDEDFFMYGEDIDLSYRLLQAGYKNYYQPCSILHYKGESTQKSSFKYVHVFHDAMLIFYNKHYKNSYRWLTPFIRLAVVGRGMIDYVIQQREHVRKIPINNDSDKRYLFLGSPTSIGKVCALSLKHHLRMDFRVASHDTLPQGHHEVKDCSKDFDYIVYDVEAYSYEQILHLIKQPDARCTLRLATFTPETGCIITQTDVFE